MQNLYPKAISSANRLVPSDIYSQCHSSRIPVAIRALRDFCPRILSRRLGHLDPEMLALTSPWKAPARSGLSLCVSAVFGLRGTRSTRAALPQYGGISSYLIWFVAVVTAFVIFAGTLYWVDHWTRE